MARYHTRIVSLGTAVTFGSHLCTVKYTDPAAAIVTWILGHRCTGLSSAPKRLGKAKKLFVSGTLGGSRFRQRLYVVQLVPFGQTSHFTCPKKSQVTSSLHSSQSHSNKPAFSDP
jgi:hypothetical protein